MELAPVLPRQGGVAMDGSHAGSTGTPRDSTGWDVDVENPLATALLARVTDAVIVIDRELRVRRWSAGAERMYGAPAQAAEGRDVRELLGLERTDCPIEELVTRIEAADAYARGLPDDTARPSTAVDIAPLAGRAGDVAGYLIVARDVTRTMVAERALRESEQRCRSIIQACGEGIVKRRVDGTITAINPAAERLLGMTKAQLEGTAPLVGVETIRADGTPLPVDERPARVALRTGKPVTLPVGIRRADGRVMWLVANAQPLRRRPGEPHFAVVTVFTDVTKQREAEERLREALTANQRLVAELGMTAERLRLALAAGDHAEWDWDVSRDVFRHGARWWELLGGRPEGAPDTVAGWLSSIHPDDRDATWRRLRDCVEGRSAECDGSHRARHTGGGWRWIRSRGRVVERDAAGRAARIVGTSTDVTAAHELHQKLLAATRLASAGTLAAGVAHEINNPLACVTANLKYALEELSPAERPHPDALRALEEAVRSAQRIASIVRSMRSLGTSARTDAPHEIDVRSEILNAVEMVHDRLAARARVDVEVPRDLPMARARTSELGRALVNLLVNAAEAIPDGDAARNRIGVAARAEAAEVIVEVADTGTGIAPEIRERIFEAFFTTKPVGAGIGLGLSIVKAIVDGAGGRVEVESASGAGSTFRVRLPIAERR